MYKVFSRTLRVMDARTENRGRPHQKVGFPAAPLMGRNFLTPGHPSVRVGNVRTRVRLGPPKPYNSRLLRLPEHFQNSLPLSLPLSMAGDASFFQKWFWRGPLRAGHGIPSNTEGMSENEPCWVKCSMNQDPCQSGSSTFERAISCKS